MLIFLIGLAVLLPQKSLGSGYETALPTLETALSSFPEIGSQGTPSAIHLLTTGIQTKIKEHHHAKESGHGDGVTIKRPGSKHLSPSWITTEKIDFTPIAMNLRPEEANRANHKCGELRIVYRPSYPLPTGGKRFLPVTLAVNLPWGKAEQKPFCQATPAAVFAALAQRSGAALHGAAASNRADDFTVQANIFTSFYPATPELQFVSQSHYLLLSFTYESNKWSALPLRDTPDVDRILASPDLRAQARAWLKGAAKNFNTMEAILEVPKTLLALQATSVTFGGANRLANRPWYALASELDSDGMGSDVAPLIRQLDHLSCQGCHQTAAIAGFHQLGDSDKEGVTLVSGQSRLLTQLEIWRNRRITSKNEMESPEVLRALLAKQIELSAHGKERQQSEPISSVGMGVPCPSGQGTPAVTGGACDPTTIYSHWHPLEDVYNNCPKTSCGGKAGMCAPLNAGFPGGYCSEYCDQDQGALRCLPVPILGDFSVCLQRSGDFFGCATKHHVNILAPHCGQHSDCRADYACVHWLKRATMCAPPYFLPSFNLDAHQALGI